MFHFATKFWNFTNFIMFHSGNSFCLQYLGQKLLYNANCLLPPSLTLKQKRRLCSLVNVKDSGAHEERKDISIYLFSCCATNVLCNVLITMFCIISIRKTFFDSILSLTLVAGNCCRYGRMTASPTILWMATRENTLAFRTLLSEWS